MVSVSQRDFQEIAEHIWWKVKSLRNVEDWALKPKPAKILTTLGLGFIAEDNLKIDDPKQRNVHLRSSISPYLTRFKVTRNVETTEPVTSPQLFDWIVYEWGNIPEGSREGRLEVFNAWDKQFNNYADSDIDRFCVEQKQNGISSWSKIASFLNYNRYPIYDTRVSAALNIAMDDLWTGLQSFRFQMPASSSRANNAAIKKIRERWREAKNGRNKYVGYNDYLRLLDTMIEQGHFTDRLDGEMHIFGVSKEMIDEYLSENEIKY